MDASGKAVQQRRIVEYFAVLGIEEAQPPSSAISGGQGDVSSPEAKGVLIQRFPLTNRKESILPVGIELFCQPLGWRFSKSPPPPPSFVDFVLTAEDGSRLYCSSLNFHCRARAGEERNRSHPPSSSSSKKLGGGKRSVSTSAVPAFHDAGLRKAVLVGGKSKSPSLESLDEVHEANWSPEDIVFLESLYRPFSLCLVSKYPLFDVLQCCLKSLYVSWVSGKFCLEQLVAEMLSCLHLPDFNFLPFRRAFGAARQLAVCPLDEGSTLPHTATSAIKLLRSLGVANLLRVLCCVLSDISVLFVSSSLTALTAAQQAICAIVFPFKPSHSLVPVVPASLVDYVQLPSTFIMGLHTSLMEPGLEENLGEVVTVYLDRGELYVPETVQLFPLPSHLHGAVRWALAHVLDPTVDHRDEVFAAGELEQKKGSSRERSLEMQDKEVRAIFLNLFVSVLGDYQSFITVIRFHPVPHFTFNKKAYLAKHCDGDVQSVFHKMIDSIAFINLTHDRSVPYRMCDFFDELVARFLSSVKEVEDLFLREHIEELSEELYNLLPPNNSNVVEVPQGVEPSSLRLASRPFPTLRPQEVEEAMADLENMAAEETDNTTPLEEPQSCSVIPLLERQATGFQRTSSTMLRELESLNSCLDAIFSSKVIEARKYVPAVAQALKSGGPLSSQLAPELVHRLLRYGVLVSSEQFDLLVKLVSCALVDEKTAIMLLPLSTIIYRQFDANVKQYLCTCLQQHYVWSSTGFWCEALYSAIQAELVRIYAEYSSKNTSVNEETDGDPNNVMCNDELAVGEITLRSRMRLRTSSFQKARNVARSMAMSRSARVRLKASAVIPGLSEGILPPDAQPVTCDEALHHLAKRLKMWPSMSEEEQVAVVRLEENAVQNQIILFIERIINLRIPVQLPKGADEEHTIVELEDFINRFLWNVEVDLMLNHGKIKDQVHDMIIIHINSLSALRREWERLPVSKVRVIKPPLLNGEIMLLEAVHCYLLPDGRPNRQRLPSEGHIFLTTYRVIFLGTPCDPEAPSVIMTRSMPIASIFRMKKFLPTSQFLSQYGVHLVGGIQLRSATAELMKIGFDEETSQMDMKRLISQLADLRSPTKVTLGLKLHQAPGTELDMSLSGPPSGIKSSVVEASTKLKNFHMLEQMQQASGAAALPIVKKGTLTRVKVMSDLSRSPYGREMRRLGVASLNVAATASASTAAVWRMSIVNSVYAMCSSYPAVIAVPGKVSDDSLLSMASHFRMNRIPAITWKHTGSQAVLMRSSSFVPCGAPGGAGGGGGGKQPHPHPPGEPSMVLPAGVGGLGVYNAEVRNLFANILLANPEVAADHSREWGRGGGRGGGGGVGGSGPPHSRNITGHVPVLPATMEFEDVMVRETDPLRRTDSVSSAGTCGADDYSSSLAHMHESMMRRCQTLDSSQSAVSLSQELQRSISESKLADKGRLKQTPSVSSISVEGEEEGIGLKDIVFEERDVSSPSQPPAAIDWEAVGAQPDIPWSPRCSTPSELPSSPEPTQPDQLPIDVTWDHFEAMDDRNQHPHPRRRSGSTRVNTTLSPGSFSSIPTGPRDWMVVDALPEKLNTWHSSALYVIGEKEVLIDVPEESNCMFIPVEVPSAEAISTSFKKLMRVCAPSTHHSGFLSSLEESGWINQLSTLMQLAGAVADLMDIQGSSVLVCLEDGWNSTAQVVSLAELLMDSHYRTLEGFKQLVEKDWLAFGHRFSHYGHHTSSSSSKMSDYSPIFLQFLDLVHQVMRQFPLSFEFNEFYLKTVAYHHCSMRFHTFTLDSEKERYSNNWLPYRTRAANIHGQMEKYVSFWDYVDELHKDCAIFYNMKYLPSNETAPLRPHSYQANLDVWDFYLSSSLSQFPAYDVELVTEGELTLMDLQHNVFERDKSLLGGVSLPLDQPGAVAGEVYSLLKQYTALRNSAVAKIEQPQENWLDLWEELQACNEIPMPDPVFPKSKRVEVHSQTLHKRTSLAVLMKGKLAVELEQTLTHPHQFQLCELNCQYECNFCKHQIWIKQEAYKCKKCGCVAHAHCKPLMPYTCGQKKIFSRTTVAKPSRHRDKLYLSEQTHISQPGSSTFYHSVAGEQSIYHEGYLYKRGKIVRNWKHRWFILNSSSRELNYYDSTQDKHSERGTIQLQDITSVKDDVEPQIVPVLKPGKPGFFFDLITQRRVFHLMALKDSDRIQWVEKIRFLCSLK